jgi:hypothetical protein
MAASRHDATLTSTKPATTPADATPAFSWTRFLRRVTTRAAVRPAG